MAPTSLTLPQLTPDSRLWRIDWFGEFAYPGAVRRYTQPSIRVVISPVLNSPEVWTPHDQVESDPRQQHQTWVPIGSLPALRIGDLWQDGRLLVEPEYQNEQFELDLGKHLPTPIKAGLSIGDDYLLPFSEHPFHALHTHSHCLSIPLKGDRRLIIPGVEMIRFYFGSSSKLLHRLITAPLQESALWREKHYNPSSGHLHLKLAERMSKASAQDIGRIALSDHAWHAAAGIHGNCLKATSRNEPAYPFIGFPFTGKTKLSVHGRWLNFQGEPERTFLAFHIRSCQHPFPFRSLSYDNPVDADIPQRKKPDTQNEGASNQSSYNRQAKSELDNADPGTQKKQREFAVARKMRFPDLAHKPVWQEQAVLSGAEEIYRRHDDGSIEKISFGEPVASGEARPIDAVVTDSRPTPAPGTPSLPHFVWQGIWEILNHPDRAGRGLAAKPLLIDGRLEPVFPLPMLVDEDGVVDPRPMFTGPDGHQRMRRICFVGLFEGELEKHQYVIVEGSKVNIHGAALEIEGNTDLLEVLSYLSDHQI